MYKNDDNKDILFVVDRDYASSDTDDAVGDSYKYNDDNNDDDV